MIANPEVLEGVQGYMGIPAILDSDGVVWLVERGAHLEASIEMIKAKLGVEKEEAVEAILSEKVIDLGVSGYFHVATKTFEAKDG
jgi:hypothetical protein